MQLPLIEDGIVVNVIEIDDDTMIMTKDRHKELQAQEDAGYADRLAAWRKRSRACHGELNATMKRLGMANMTLSAVKIRAADEKQDAKAALLLRQILSMEADIEQHQRAVEIAQATPLPPKPRLVRAKRWFHPPECTVGPEGGNIGDRWDGKQYVRPEKAEAVKSAEPVVAK